MRRQRKVYKVSLVACTIGGIGLPVLAHIPLRLTNLSVATKQTHIHLSLTLLWTKLTQEMQTTLYDEEARRNNEEWKKEEQQTTVEAARANIHFQQLDVSH